MNIYVVMGRHQARRDSIAEQLSRLQLSFKEMPAVYLDSIPESASGSQLKIAEIGCVLAHQACYRDMLSTGASAALILEDDAILDERVARLDLDALVAYADIVLLGLSKLSFDEYKNAHHFFPLIRKSNVGELQIGKPYKIRSKGCVGYVCSQNAAKKLLKLNQNQTYVSDDWLRYSSSIVIAESRPFLVYENDVTFISDIELQRSGKFLSPKTMSGRKILGRYLKGYWIRLLILLGLWR